jgi:hypothetical protein
MLIPDQWGRTEATDGADARLKAAFRSQSECRVQPEIALMFRAIYRTALICVSSSVSYERSLAMIPTAQRTFRPMASSAIVFAIPRHELTGQA